MNSHKSQFHNNISLVVRLCFFFVFLLTHLDVQSCNPFPWKIHLLISFYFEGILDTILSVQPKEGGGDGGETRESIVYQLADDMLRKLPPQYNAFEVRENLNRMGVLLPMNIFLRCVVVFHILTLVVNFYYL